MGIIFDKPLIGVVMCQNLIGNHPGQTVHNKYLDAIVLAGGVPLPLPHQLTQAPHLLENSMTVLDGILLTGSPSNIEPWHYGEDGKEAHADPARDRLAFGLITHAIGKKMPMFGICRGLQELVVATGGTLHRQLHVQPGLRDHREDGTLSLDEQYAPAHDIVIEPDGLLQELVAGETAFWVNSLHQQGIKTLGPSLRSEARSADGLIEAVSLRDHPFALGVQWHPEWHAAESLLSQQLFGGFIRASQRYQQDAQP